MTTENIWCWLICRIWDSVCKWKKIYFLYFGKNYWTNLVQVDLPKAHQVATLSVINVLKIADDKGQFISKCLSGFFTFSQKTNENKSTSSKDELFRSFFGRKWQHHKTFWNKLTFTYLKILVRIDSPEAHQHF